MIRKIQINDLEEANILLSNFNYKLTKTDLNKVFFNSLVSVDDKINGIIVYNLFYDRIEIEYIIVSKEHRKNHIGSKLLLELEKENINNITLEVRESNIEAISFYKANGYKIEAIRKNYYGNEDGYLMMKEIGE
jgi:ribosomal protein S18 acetylase RimI-like enzyme